jgi:ribosomal protein S18 acetylase RimI-like enzyme
MLRPATPDDFGQLFSRTRALNAHEGIELDDAALERAVRRLLAEPDLGRAWLIERDDGVVIGYAIVTWGYDFEFGGRDAYLTELWIDSELRGQGAGAAALAELVTEMKRHAVGALHLLVRPDNPARRLYERAGFVASPRVVMTRTLR